MIKDAKFSECGKYRYWLTRTWNPNEHDELILMLIGLNPSSAGSEKDDPTIRRIISLAKSNGYDSIVMTNLFAFITPYPDQLNYENDDIFNMGVLKATGNSCADVCFCWGNFMVAERKALTIEKMFPDAKCFGKNKNGSPKHPLYLRSNTHLIKF